jgi:hypothetical protein
MACDPITFRGINQSIFNLFKQNAIKLEGVKWEGNDTGSFSKTQAGMIVKTDYWFDPNAETFKLQVVEKPLIISCDFLHGKFHDGLQKCGAVNHLPSDG